MIKTAKNEVLILSRFQKKPLKVQDKQKVDSGVFDRANRELLPNVTVISTGQRINELENGPSSYRQKGIYFEWVFM